MSTPDRRRFLAGCAAGVTLGWGMRHACAAPSIALRDVPSGPPPAARTLLVPETYPNVRAALTAAQPADHISLADGTYPGDVDLTHTVALDPGRHIVVRARNRHKAVFTGRIAVRSPGIWLHELQTNYRSAAGRLDGDNYSIRLMAGAARVTRCLIRSNSGLRVLLATAKRRRPDHRLQRLHRRGWQQIQ